MNPFFRTKSIDQLVAASEDPAHRWFRALLARAAEPLAGRA